MKDPINSDNTVDVSTNKQDKSPSEILLEAVNKCNIKITEDKSQNDNELLSDQMNLKTEQTKDHVQKTKRKRPPAHIREQQKKRVKFLLPTVKTDDTSHVGYALMINNMPNNWGFQDIKSYIDMQCGGGDDIGMIKDDNQQTVVRVIYQTENECKQALEKLSRSTYPKFTLSMTVMDFSLRNENVEYEKFSGNENVDTPLPPGVDPVPESLTDWRPDMDSWDIDPKGTYGLKESFLKSLNITPPIDRWVQVCNIEWQKHDVRDLMGLAGHVVQCAINAFYKKYANVMYSHPLEAVQAVSMLNGQEYNGQILRVIMIRSPNNTTFIARGLKDIGQGLGAHGRPLRNIVKHYERYINKQTASLNQKAFSIDDYNLLQYCPPFTKKNILDIKLVETPEDIKSRLEITSKNKTKSKKMETESSTPKLTDDVTSVPTPQPAKPVTKQMQKKQIALRMAALAEPSGNNCGPFRQPRPMWQAGPGPNVAPFGSGPRSRMGWNGPRPKGPMQGSMGPQGLMGSQESMEWQGLVGGPKLGSMDGQMGGPMGGAMGGPRLMGGSMGSMQGPVNPMQNIQRPMGSPAQAVGGPMLNPNEPVQLQLNNLPPSTTFGVLCERMAAVGTVLSIQLTTPGAAVVTFANRAHADNCYKTYHNFCVEGCVIQVKYT